MIEIKNVSKKIGRKEILKDVNCVIENGTYLCVKNCRELVCEVEGKVIACEKGQEVVLKCDYYIEKQYENNGKIFYRVIISDPDCGDGFQALKPTIEDGYMAIIKGL